MFIDSTTLKRVNIHAPYKGFSRLDTEDIRTRAGVIEIADPVRESDETHYNQEIDDAPYLISTPKPQEQIDAAHNAKIRSQIAALEASELLPRIVRDLTFKSVAADAAALGMTLEQIYALASEEGAPEVAKAYKKFKDFDQSIADLKAQLR